MEITESMVYWITRLDYVVEVVRFIGILFTALSTVGVVFAGSIVWNAHYKKDKNFGGSVKLFVVMCLILFLCLSLAISSIFIPTTKEMCAIKVIPAVANNDEIQELPNKVVELANDWIDKLSPEK